MPAVFVGVCSAVGGGILRDMFMGLPVAIMHVGSLYAVAAAAGCLVLAVAHAFGVPLIVAAIVGVVVTAVIRVLAVVFDISLPEQRDALPAQGRRRDRRDADRQAVSGQCVKVVT